MEHGRIGNTCGYQRRTVRSCQKFTTHTKAFSTSLDALEYRSWHQWRVASTKYCRGSRMQLLGCFIPCGVQSGTAHDGQLLEREEGKWRLFQRVVIEEGQ